MIAAPHLDQPSDRKLFLLLVTSSHEEDAQVITVTEKSSDELAPVRLNKKIAKPLQLRNFFDSYGLVC
jgi:hypothetical protein